MYLLDQNKKIRYTLANPIFLLKGGLGGYWLHGHVFLMICIREKLDKVAVSVSKSISVTLDI